MTKVHESFFDHFKSQLCFCHLQHYYAFARSLKQSTLQPLVCDRQTFSSSLSSSLSMKDTLYEGDILFK